MDPILTTTTAPPKTASPIVITSAVSGVNQTVVPPEVSKKSSTGLIVGVLFLAILLISMLVGGYVLIISPRKNEVAYTRKLVTYFPQIRTSIGKVVSSFDELYTLVTGKKVGSNADKQLLRLNITPFVTGLRELAESQTKQGMVAGASTEKSRFYFYSPELAELKQFEKGLQGVSQFGQKQAEVLGSASDTTDSTVKYQETKAQSSVAITSTQEANSKLSEMQAYLLTKQPPTVSEQLKDELKNIQTTSASTSDYLSEMYKTAHYYHESTDVGMKMAPLLVSWLTLLRTLVQTSQPELSLGKVEELRTTLVGLGVQLKALDGDNLPKGLDALHSDNKKIIDLLITNMDEIKASINQRNFAMLTKSVQTLNQSIDPLITRAQLLEDNFWQDNQTFKQHGAIAQKLKDQEDALAKVVTADLLPPFIK